MMKCRGAFWEQSREVVHGWWLSLLFHGVLGAAAVFMMTNVLPIPKPEPFRLSMTLVKSPPRPVTQPQPIRKMKTERSPVKRPVVSQQPPVQQQTVKARPQTAPRLNQQVKQVKPILKKVVPSMPRRQPLAARPVQRTASAVPRSKPISAKRSIRQAVMQDAQPVRTAAKIQQQPVRPVNTTQSKPTAVQQQVSARTHPPSVADRQPETRSGIQHVATVSRHGATPTEYVVESVNPTIERVSAIVTDSISREMPRVPQSPAQTVPATRPMAPPRSTKRSVTVPQRRVFKLPVITKDQPTIVTRDVQQYPAPSMDYGWVANTLLDKVQQLKRYPPLARRKNWEGTVALRVSIRADGEIEDVRIIESSGHETLDREALKTVKMASPLTLNHPLGSPLVMFDLPMKYTLN